MSNSRLQEPFMEELVQTFRATNKRLVQRLSNSSSADADSIVEDEMRGLYHGLLVILDGGTSLADKGLVSVIDEDGVAFDRFLHEICFQYWPKDDVSA